MDNDGDGEKDEVIPLTFKERTKIRRLAEASGMTIREWLVEVTRHQLGLESDFKMVQSGLLGPKEDELPAGLTPEDVAQALRALED